MATDQPVTLENLRGEMRVAELTLSSLLERLVTLP
jgi:hypothetical protein